MEIKDMRVASGVLAVASDTRKLTKKRKGVYTTYTHQNSCGDCPLKNNGCYAEVHWTGKTARRLDPHSSDTLAENEAEEILKLSHMTPKPLRLHEIGDCKTPYAASVVAEAARKFMDRTKQAVWTYTHSWREVPRFFWNKVSILASCHTVEQVKEAHSKGYAAAIVVDEFKNGKKAWKKDGFTFIPCPNQATDKKEGITCDECKLCWKDRQLHATKSVIAFELHGLVAKHRKDSLVEKDN
jgi:hypothetical protein